MVMLCKTAKIMHYSAFPNSVDTFKPKIFENSMKNDCFVVMGTLKTCKMGHLISNNVFSKGYRGLNPIKIGRFSKFLCLNISSESEKPGYIVKFQFL